ncbi:MAG: glycosyl hydrolase family 95 catalytic domain-containing protein [Mangrovibacterium sp.]
MKNLKLILVLFTLVGGFFSCQQEKITTKKSKNDLVFSELATRWDEAVPLGNATLGALVWQNGENLRFSLDRVDLWDLRPMDNLDTPAWKYTWVYDQWKNDNYKVVQDNFDAPYGQNPAPSKIPAAAMEFNTQSFGEVDSVRLSITDAVCEVNWKSGVSLQTFVNASKQNGWFRFEGLTADVKPVIIPPAYVVEGDDNNENVIAGKDLRRLGYQKGELKEAGNQITYTQEGWGGFKYQVHVSWEQKDDQLVGCWSISSEFPEWEATPKASEVVAGSLKDGFAQSYAAHRNWWDGYWAKSSVQLPDPVIEKQWYLELYKFGSAARSDAPPISLQAVWTADNGKLPPWKGDFHHDLNTQLSYWLAFSGNHIDLEEGYINWMLKNKDTFKSYTKNFYETNGINVPGVSTLTGDPMGGWIQYAFGPTVSAWLGQFFYLHWRYTMDRDFLEEKAYPWISEVAIHLDELSVKGKDGMRKLPISASPEVNNNSRGAWFGETTNFDLALIRFAFSKAAELAGELGKADEQKKWEGILAEWPYYSVDEETGLKIATTLPFNHSHRHFSHLLAIHPLGILDMSSADEAERELILKSVGNLKAQGSGAWTGYSFSWMANLQARIFDGEGAAESLRIFAENFCLPNSFHVNGEQYNRGYSNLKYRPFTLEGNFAFASGVQEMLIQSHTGIVKIFPAIPKDWKDVSFHQLRTDGAFLVSAERKDGELSTVEITADADGTIQMENAFAEGKYTLNGEAHSEKLITITLKKGEKVMLAKQ